jgi:hypothetical protein
LSECSCVTTTTSSVLDSAPFVVVRNFNVFFSEESAQIKLLKVGEEVCYRHPERTISLADFGLSNTSLLHSFIHNSASSLSPLFAGVTPSALPFGFFTPRVSQLDQFVALNFKNIKH